MPYKAHRDYDDNSNYDIKGITISHHFFSKKNPKTTDELKPRYM